MRFRCIVFDCDGVLILNSNEIYDEALTLTAQEFKPDFPTSALQQLMSQTRGKTFVHQLRRILGDGHPRLEEAIKYYENYIHLESSYRRISSVDEENETLISLKRQGYLLALATGMNPSLLARLFGDGILPEVFERVASLHDISEPELQKPHPKLLLDVLDGLKLSPAEAIYVGDTADDIEMARRGEVFSVAVLTGRLNEKQAFDAGADLILASILELPKWTEKRSSDH
jgi:phosphoglycolate phosphatase